MNDPLDEVLVSRPKEDPETLVLRGRPRPVVRFRRGLIVGLCGALAAGVATLSWVALEPARPKRVAQPPESEDLPSQASSEALAGAPKGYGDVPRLGPALPGDLGRPILEQQRFAQSADGQELDPERSRTDQARAASEADLERENEARAAARSSPVLVQLADTPGSKKILEPSPQAESGDHDAVGGSGTGSAAVPESQQHKIEFAVRGAGAFDTHRLQAPMSSWTLAAGTIIPANLITGLNSDLPGMVLAQVSENVRDSATGHVVLIPQGARLLGRYDSAVAYGQRRALLVWTRILFPDGSSIEIDNAAATDSSGSSGLEDRVDSHGWQLLKGIVLSTLLGVSAELSLGGSESELARAFRESAQQNVAHAGDQLTSRNLEVQPTIRIRPGWPVRALLGKDLVLQPWKG